MIHPDRSIEGTAVDADAQIFAALYPSLRRYAAVIGSLSDDPDDLVQEAVARTLRQNKLAELDSPAAYLRRSISNLVINGARSDMSDRSRNHLVVTDDEWRDVYPSDLGLLEQLSPTERAVLLLADIEGRPFGEVAQIVGCTPVAARLRASRARRRLQRLLEEDS